MENKYRESLRSAKAKEGDPSSLFCSSWLYKEQKENISKPLKKQVKTFEQATEESISAPSEVTEKTVILDSLNVFGNEKLEEKEAFKFSGGELAKKEEVAIPLKENQVQSTSYPELLELIMSKRGQADSFESFSGKSFSLESRLKVLFITDDGEIKSESPPDYLGAFTPYFDDEVSNLFYKMVKAMRLNEFDFYISSIQFSSSEDMDLLYNEIEFFKPEMIISLGALATHKILDSKDRLKDSHGQISKISIKNDKNEVISIAVMPLFSPTLLQTAPNMKKTAWKDMQKAMEYLNL